MILPFFWPKSRFFVVFCGFFAKKSVFCGFLSDFAKNPFFSGLVPDSFPKESRTNVVFWVFCQILLKIPFFDPSSDFYK